MLLLKTTAARLLKAPVVGSIRALQSSWLEKYAVTPLGHQPVFLIGAPRTGSTILYQALTNYFDILYLDNLACRWHDSLPFGIWLSSKRYGRSPHNNFLSSHGNTSRFGGHAPSECGGFWYRWLPADRHFVDDHEITDAMVDGVRREITAVSNYFKRPLLFKNLNAGQRLRLIERCFPGARFIHVKRNPGRTIDSILAARRRVGVREGQWWSIMPPDYKAFMALPERDMVAAQIQAIDEQIELDLKRFPDVNHRVVHLEDFSSELVEVLGQWLGLGKREGGSLPTFKRETTVPVAASAVPDTLGETGANG